MHPVPDFHDGHHHAHRHVLITGVGGELNDRADWPHN
jgi:hypothetical protein